MGNYNVLAPEQFKQFSGRTIEASIAIRPEVIDSSKIPFEPDEERYALHGKIVDQSTSGNILSYYVDCSGINLRVDELYRSFNLFKVGEDVHLSFEKRNCLEV
ncbi:TOBE domain-containing protein [Carnobacterium sp.]|uniref:TOBE domain-containing protein n=1 Tax=Carnobacterium sp. TaxID=48221 RepID=UPI0028AF811A|nr:TOBE domain-containing protein [Carnobacterium sp.]